MRSGMTLVELAFVLLLCAAGLGTGLAAARRIGDRAAVAGARELAAGMVVRARAEALASGGAVLRLRVTPPTLVIETADSVVALQRLDDLGIQMTLGGGATEVRIAFDALGLGRVASRTLVFRRGESEARLVIAAYGRAVRS